ncbi:rhomboid family intramembrane serine protease [Candidatus Woesearchaeota archaeon]|nr:rhomboid family intramembrane serine protease [Candidatus Woesearchaeota archaeon]
MRHNYWSALWLSFFIFLIFILQNILNNITDIFILDSSLYFTRPWTLITAIFLHSNIQHLFYNLFGLALFGTILEYIIGTKKFLKLFFIAGLIASLASIPFYSRVLGASGAIFGIIGTLAMLRPRLMVWVYGMPMPMIVALFIWGIGDLLGILAPSGTANIAHLAGMAYGIFVGFKYRKNFAEKKPKKEKVHIDEGKVKEWEKSF